jgi:hypothetical protein
VIIEGDTVGFFRVHLRKGTDRILGATLVAAHAGESISEVTLAMAGGFGLGRIAGVMHPYPTEAEAIRKAGDAYNREPAHADRQATLRMVGGRAWVMVWWRRRWFWATGLSPGPRSSGG